MDTNLSNNEYSLIITTCENRETAKAIAKLLVERRLVACVQMIPIDSIYLWKEKICEESETMLLIKSRKILFEEVVIAIRENHTYEIPEVVQIPITGGLSEYLKWIDDCTI